MKRKSLLTLSLICLISLSLTRSHDGTVKWVNDGDTILLTTGESVRYVGIDAPEMGHKGGKNDDMACASKALNRHLVAKRRVRLVFDQVRRDRHGRLLAYVYLENGEMVNAVMVRKGLAHVMAQRPNLRHFSLLLENQRKAMKEKIGIWREASRPPERQYYGNTQSFRFHRPSCPFSRDMHPRHLMIFKKRYDALWKGYSPCRRCRP